MMLPAKPLALAALFGLCWSCSPAIVRQAPPMQMWVHADGSVDIDGTHFNDTDALKAKLNELAHRAPKPSVFPYPDKDTKLEITQRLARLLEDADLLPPIEDVIIVSQ